MGRYLTALLFITAFASAQNAPEGISPELLARILGADAEVQVGGLPETLPVPLMLPEGIAVDAAVTRSWVGQKSVQLFLTSSLLPEETTAELSQSLEVASLTPFTPPKEAYGWGWGFVNGSKEVLEPTLFCGADAYAELFREEGGNPAQLMLTLNTRPIAPNAYSPCDIAAYPMGRELPPVPTLAPPPDLTPIGFESGYAFSAQTSYIAFEAGPPLGTFVEHYRTLLEKAGWREELAGKDEALQYSRWLGESETGEPWFLVMIFVGEALRPGMVIGALVATPAERP